ncbi:MAG TPA: glycosyltransferase family 9 protein [Candidatus Sulfotelmatobacter sp.]
MSDREGLINRFLVIRLSAMGDVIHTLPAVQALRAAYPQARIDWLIEERWAELLCAPGTPRRGTRSARRPLVDSVHTVKLAEWRKTLLTIQSLQGIATAWNDVRSVRYDVAFDLQGAIRSAILARCSGAREVFGAAEPRELPASLWYTRKAIACGRHVIEQSISIVESFARQKLAVPDAILPSDPTAEVRAVAKLNSIFGASAKGMFILMNPGAGWGAKQWPPERYGQVAQELVGDGVCSLINYGPGEEGLAKAVVAASHGSAHAINCSISELIALIRQARLVIAGDTGPLHLAAALKIPVVAIFGPTDPARNGPYGTRSIVLRSPASLNSYTRRPHADAGLLEIGTDAVLNAARALLTGSRNG